MAVNDKLISQTTSRPVPNSTDLVLLEDATTGEFIHSPLSAISSGSGGGGGVTDHTLLTNIGTNTHAQIDTAIAASTSHIADTSNPHSVTKAQVGLSNADNTSDANKPVSTATQTALNGKSDTSHTHVSSDITDLAETIEDTIGTKVVAGTNVTVNYNDTTGVTTIAASGGSSVGALDDLTDVAISSPSTGQVIKYNGSAWVNDSDATGGGGTNATNLSTTTAASTVTVVSDTGTDAVIPAATAVAAGVLTSTDKSKLDGIAAGATANSSDATLLARANHTGTQTASTISDFSTAADARIAAEISTGTGTNVRATSPTLVTPALGVATATSINKVAVTAPTTSATLTIANLGTLATSGAFSITLTATATTNVTLPTTGTLATVSGALGTPTSATLTNATGLPIATGVSGLGTGVATFLATPTSANLATAVTNETGTGALVFGTSPTIVTPTIASFANATHDHAGAAGGGVLTHTALPAGSVVQVVSTTFSSQLSGTGTIPVDNTIPQNTEGDQYMSQSITPKATTNLLLIEAVIQLQNSVANNMIAALFQDTTANALAAAHQFLDTGTANLQLVIRYSMLAGTTSATTFKIRAGGGSAGTTTFNAALFGAISRSSLVITEVKL